MHILLNDARSFFDKHLGKKYDVVCYGLLDSHAMASAMSTLRLDNYVYTAEGIRAAWLHVAPTGHLSLAMSCYAGSWFIDRLFWTIAAATGQKPLMLYSPMHGGTMTYVVLGTAAHLNAFELTRHEQLGPRNSIKETQMVTDDWPFLYIRPHIFPWGYLAVLSVVLIFAVLSVRYAFGLTTSSGQFHSPLFLMGAAFLLIETRGVTSLSLLFGSTWIVNSSVFAGILLMVLLGNLAVRLWHWTNPLPWFIPLLFSIAFQYFFPIPWLHVLPPLLAGLTGGLLIGLPVGFAGIIVPILLAKSTNPSAALGSNLLGAVVGGCLEYLSLICGLRSLLLLALVLYLFALLLLSPKRSTLVTNA